MYAGWDDMGTFAAEVEDGPKTYVMGAGLAFVAVVLAYLLPVIAGLTVGPDYGLWDEGYFVTLDSMSAVVGMVDSDCWLFVSACSLSFHVSMHFTCFVGYGTRSKWKTVTCCFRNDMEEIQYTRLLYSGLGSCHLTINGASIRYTC